MNIVLRSGGEERAFVVAVRAGTVIVRRAGIDAHAGGTSGGSIANGPGGASAAIGAVATDGESAANGAGVANGDSGATSADVASGESGESSGKNESAAIVMNVIATPGGIVLEHAGRRLPAAASGQGTGSPDRQLWLAGRTLSYQRVHDGAGRGAEKDTAMASTIPAVVLEVLVERGQHVEQGDRLILLESMKMVLPILASRSGTVNAILCSVGEAVQPGVPLVEVNPAQ